MKKALLFSLFAASVLAAACESTQTNTASGSAKQEDADVITGSRIPRRGGSSDGAVQSSSREAYKQGQIERSGNGGMSGQ